MNILKTCPFCSKEIPDELDFCPYCMNKLSGEQQPDTVAPANPKKKKTILITVISAVAACLIALAVILAVHSKNTGASDTMKTTAKTSKTTTAASSDSGYTKYIGTWVSEDTDEHNTDKDNIGGVELDILAVSGNTVRFTLTKTGASPYSRIAELDNVTGTVKGNILSFKFTDDGWGNSGSGKLKFSDGEIFAEATVTKTGEVSLWDIGMTEYLTKYDTGSRSVNYSYLLKDFNKVKSDFGEQTNDRTYSDYDGTYTYHFGILDVNADYNNGIEVMSVDYKNSVTKKEFVYDNQIDGTSTYEDVVALLGQPDVNTLNESKEVTYDIVNGEYVKFYFNDSYTVTGFMLFTDLSA